MLGVDPNYPRAHLYLSEAYRLQGRYTQAISEIQKANLPGDPFVLSLLGRIYALEDRRREALEIVRQLKDRSKLTYVDAGTIARVYVALGEKEQALGYLQRPMNSTRR